MRKEVTSASSSWCSSAQGSDIAASRLVASRRRYRSFDNVARSLKARVAEINLAILAAAGSVFCLLHAQAMQMRLFVEVLVSHSVEVGT